MRLNVVGAVKAALFVAPLLLPACIPAPAPEIEWVAAPFDQAREAADSRGKLRKGDVVRVVIKEGEKKDVFDVHAVDETAFLGVSLRDHKTYRVHYSALRSMEVRRWALGWTVLTPTIVSPAR
jgi:hypothetical protein